METSLLTNFNLKSLHGSTPLVPTSHTNDIDSMTPWKVCPPAGMWKTRPPSLVIIVSHWLATRYFNTNKFLLPTPCLEAVQSAQIIYCKLAEKIPHHVGSILKQSVFIEDLTKRDAECDYYLSAMASLDICPRRARVLARVLNEGSFSNKMISTIWEEEYSVALPEDFVDCVDTLCVYAAFHLQALSAFSSDIVFVIHSVTNKSVTSNSGQAIESAIIKSWL